MSKMSIQRSEIRRALDSEVQRERRRILDLHFPGGATAAQLAMIDLVAKAAVYRRQIARLNHSLGLGQLEAVQPADEWAEIYREACQALGIPAVLLTEKEGHA